MLIEADAGTRLAQDACQRRLSHLEGLPAHVGAVQLEQVERIEEGFDLVPPPAQDIEPGEPALIAADHLPVDQAGPHLEMGYGLDDQREPVESVIAAPGDEPDADRIPTRHQPVAVVLNLMNPVGAGRRAVRR
jgi:hypothetical protein